MGNHQRNNPELHFHQISDFSRKKIRKIKWLKTALDHLAILTSDNIFQIFDVNEDIDNPEFIFPLNLEEKEVFVDFVQGKTNDFFDLGYFSIFFLGETGNIFYLTPILLKNSFVKKKNLEFLRKRVACDESLAEDILLKIHRFCTFYEKNSILKNGKLYVKSTFSENKKEFPPFLAKVHSTKK